MKQELAKEIISSHVNDTKNGKSNNLIFNNETRVKTFVEILVNPGIHTRELQRRLGVSLATVNWHIQVLEGHKLIESVKRGYYTSFYPVGKFLKRSREVFIPCDARKKILDYIRAEQGASQKETSDFVGVHQSTARYHLRKLIDSNIILEVKDGKSLRYFAPPR